MRTQDLYPELTDAEIEQIIGPLTVIEPEADDAEGATPVAIRPVHRALDEFGTAAERYSFDRVSQHVAEVFHEQYWDPRDDAMLDDPPAFAAAVRGVLATDTVELAIRPLADSMRPESGVDEKYAYQKFCQELLADGLVEFAAAYPALWERLSTHLRQRVYAVGEAVQRLHDDWDLLSTTFEIGSEAKVSTLSLAGDTHGGGRNVSVVELNDGSKLVYKPRPVDCEAGYRDLVGWLDSEFGSSFRAAAVLSRGSYGYVEFVQDDPETEVDVFGVGQLAALLYALNARDMHFTNILSTTDGPVPVDLETLLHPHRHKATGTIEPDDSGYKLLEASVFGTGVLPVVMTTEDRDGYIDVGYLGGGEVRGSGPFRNLRVEHHFSSRMRVTWAPDVPASVDSEAVAEAAADAVRRSCAEMVAGFTDMYERIRSRREDFAAAVERFFGRAEIRYIHNATMQYAKCLRMLTGSSVSANPELARGLVKRIGIASRDADVRLIDSECRQMWRVDVPYFLVRADRPLITDGSADRFAVADIERSPLEQFRAKIDSLSAADLATQVRLIRVAFNGKLPDPHVMTSASTVLDTAYSEPSSLDECRELAAEVGDGLIAEMVRDRYAHLPHTWIGPVANATANRPWPPGVLGYDLYTGRIGPALALAGLARVLEEPRFAEASMRVFGPTQRILAEESYEARSIAHAGNGAYNGFPGALWALAYAGTLLDDQELVDTARRSIHLLKPSAPADDGWFDMITGDMGASLVGLALGERSAIPAAVMGCQAALDSGWVRRAEYSGFAHGLAGTMHLAARTHEIVRDPASAKLVSDVQTELTTAFRSSSGGIRTNRTGQENDSDSWCNGTVGILAGLNSAVAAGLADVDVLRQTVEAIPGGSIATSCTMCHGALGLYEILGQLPADIDDTTGSVRDKLAAYLSVGRLREFLASPDSRYSQGPCLMVGRAGVAWHLLTRITDQKLPSPLTMGQVASHD